ncbi:uncharacterized protein SPAPADRAFT_139688 [Spathaspora passalidarum NRRL Y-27907]|uniref:37S ribosomal protein mrp10, mitochondrial n=1 Tax=Spathaspora passalidarum (strain NRRL Y-27907 / 11-Y1) TaxID=619300 RepID=G3AP30_SPAPN|nr:uncharacterized protein SPAPADRAFT_139688 [Spathaspora passalidarum NRRL Y-27907]EGW32061.1 hypothetical protein SPAPADRAFT_139688 [Spathaspora passalidarum NRRL Y-27907]
MAYKKVGPPPKGLPPLPQLRIRRPVSAGSQASNPCTLAMSTLLNCWASNGGDGAAVCLPFANDLKKCMETQKSDQGARNNINYHTARLYPKLKGRRD